MDPNLSRSLFPIISSSSLPPLPARCPSLLPAQLTLIPSSSLFLWIKGRFRKFWIQNSPSWGIENYSRIKVQNKFENEQSNDQQGYPISSLDIKERITMHINDDNNQKRRMRRRGRVNIATKHPPHHLVQSNPRQMLFALFCSAVHHSQLSQPSSPHPSIPLPLQFIWSHPGPFSSSSPPPSQNPSADSTFFQFSLPSPLPAAPGEKIPSDCGLLNAAADLSDQLGCPPGSAGSMGEGGKGQRKPTKSSEMQRIQTLLTAGE
jgi:hypothetical protein